MPSQYKWLYCYSGMKHDKHKYNSGDDAPQFNTTDVMGKKVNLSKYRKKSVLLVFLRYSGCPWCNLTIHRLSLEYPLLKKQNCEIIAFIQSDAENIKSNVYSRHTIEPKFPIIADPKKLFYNLYGIERSHKTAMKSVLKLPQWTQAVMKHKFVQTKIDGDIFLVPATFLISAHTQKITKADYGTSYYSFESFFSIYELLEFEES